MISARPRVALVGCGRIGPAHVSAFRAAGWYVASVTARPDSHRLEGFAKKYEIGAIHHGVESLLEDANWDAAVIATSVESLVENAGILAGSGKPLLVEKPVALSPAAIRTLLPWSSRILVGYNRRFYRPVQIAHSYRAERGAALIDMTLPERIPGSVDDEPRERQFLANSTHGLDLLRFLVGDLTVTHVKRIGPARAPTGGTATLVASGGDVIQLLMPWNTADNSSIGLSWESTRFELRPFEIGRILEGLEVVEPTPDYPVRRYIPRVKQEYVVDSSPGLKPGFVGQAQALMRLLNGDTEDVAADLGDAISAAQLAQEVLRRLKHDR